MSRRQRIGTLEALMLIALASWSAAAGAQSCAPDSMVAHAPVRVVYDYVGGLAQIAIISPANDGSVRAVDAATTAPLWTFSPPEVASASATTDVLTDLRVLRFDANGDGVVDVGAGDKVWLYFGLRRGGAAYYALDISDRTHVHVLWRADATTLGGLSDAWSTPTIARVRVGGAHQNGERFVLIFGGGHDTAGGGNRIFMVDAATGHLLWQAGATAADLVLANMTSPIAAGITAVDTDADDYADRLYAVDASGLVWRFDIWNGHPSATLVTGGVIADLRDPALTAAAAPHFFNTPDVALIQPRGGTPYYNVAIGSDRFYAIRDRLPFDARSQASYDAATPILLSDLVQVSGATQSVPDAPGWTLALGTGEKVAASSITANGVVMFTTFQQTGASSTCAVTGSTRIYAVLIDTAQAGVDLDGDGRITSTDVSQALPMITEPTAVSIRMGAPDAPVAHANDSAPPPALTPQCIVGPTTLKACVTASALVRTFWLRRGVK